MKGLYAEKLFEAECLKRNIKIHTPSNPNARYDFLIDLGNNDTAKIQVKSTRKKANWGNRSAYNFKLYTKNNKEGYMLSEVDYFAVYIEPLDIWYVIPHKAVENVKNLSLNPESKNVSIYDVYENAFNLIGE